MKRIIVLLGILAVLVCALFLIFDLTNVRAPFSMQQQGDTISITTASLEENTDVYSMDAQYPQFGISSIDAQIQKAVEAAAQDIRSAPANPPDSAVEQNTLQGSFDKIYAGADYISVELALSEYTGGAHPSTDYVGMVFDRKTGSELTLNDALSLTGLTLAQLSVEATSDLQKQLGEEFQFPEGASADPQNFQSFVVDQKSVTFIFEQYQVAAYAAGVQYVSIPRLK